MNKSQIELEFLLNLLDAGCKNAYISSIDLFNDHGSHLTRIEMILQNVGRLCLYQDFTELVDGEQVPRFTVFYYDAAHTNIRTKIKDKQLLKTAVNIVYKTKKYIESDPKNEIIFDQELIERTKHNMALANTLYEKRAKKLTPFFQMLYKQK